jgi:hypothetical protein
MCLKGCADETEGDGVKDNPVDVLKHTNAEVETAHIHCLGSFPFPRSHLRRGLSPRGTRGAAIIDPSIVVSVLSFMSSFYEIRLSGRLNDWRRWCGRTDNNFIVIICITKLMHDFNNDTDAIALARRQNLQQIKATCDKS